jgi:hypothetical protein
MGQCISYLQTSRKSDSFKREVLYNNLVKYGIIKKLVRLIKMHLNETYISYYNNQKQGNSLMPLSFNFALEYAIRRV